ncbi:hypothetical protein PV327_001808 [Microctonus hyperodae]|uniref:Uncharacterized protein n=1 Tax=Microctonus hyperodae TaxID=165561 RepID=A0AA39FEC6_MICHY|nr:hypothetical protein PV327_001808 [Microctonus hyperodae]
MDELVESEADKVNKTIIVNKSEVLESDYKQSEDGKGHEATMQEEMKAGCRDGEMQEREEGEIVEGEGEPRGDGTACIRNKVEESAEEQGKDDSENRQQGKKSEKKEKEGGSNETDREGDNMASQNTQNDRNVIRESEGTLLEGSWRIEWMREREEWWCERMKEINRMNAEIRREWREELDKIIKRKSESEMRCEGCCKLSETCVLERRVYKEEKQKWEAESALQKFRIYNLEKKLAEEHEKKMGETEERGDNMNDEAYKMPDNVKAEGTGGYEVIQGGEYGWRKSSEERVEIQINDGLGRGRAVKRLASDSNRRVTADETVVGYNRGELWTEDTGECRIKRARRDFGRGDSHMVEDYGRMPKKLSDEEFFKEMREREWRKKNICVKTVGECMKAKDAMKVIEQITGINWRDVAEKTWVLNDNVVTVRMKDMADKVELMRRKGRMKGSDIWIEDDLTMRENEVQKWLRSEANMEERKGNQARTAYMKIEREGEWWRWNEKDGTLDRIFRRRDSY